MLRRRRPPEQEAESAPTEAAIATPVEHLKELAELREQGILTEEEFAAEKKRLLGI
jgi:putative oligomerization/nucleic acid binding protein